MIHSKVILETVSRVSKVSVSKILSPLRSRNIHEARLLAIRFLADKGETHETISWILNRTRPAISYAFKAQKLEYERSERFRKMCETIQSKLDEKSGTAQSV